MSQTASIVAIDIGNSNTDIGLFNNTELLASDFLPSAHEYTDKICNTLKKWQDEYHFDNILIASVVPALGDLLVTKIETALGIHPYMVEGFKTELLPLRVDRPETVGVDRAVNCYAAMHLFGTPAIVVSLGTATTFEVISKQGEYLGGSIVPGVKISLEALTQRTALLPPVQMRQVDTLIAKNTVGHIESGIYYGTLSMIEGMVNRIQAELNQPVNVIGTGGLGRMLETSQVFHHYEPQLTLKGLALIYKNIFATGRTGF